MARIDDTGTKPRAVVDGECQRISRRRNGDPHVRSGVEIVIRDVDVFAIGPWLWADEQPRLVFVVDAT
jgi:hypothetical protein